MILRPLEYPARVSQEFVTAWPAVERTQTENYESCWLITQPSHAALAAELAAKISAPAFPAADAHIIRSIALHDAGWGIPDAQAIMKSRSAHPVKPQSFVVMPVPQFVAAWQSSIETCQSISPAGGYIVSRHFWRLAQHRAGAAHNENKSDRQKLESFLRAEERRQAKLAGKQSLEVEQLERLTDLLQFCDLLSLYLCSGAADNVEFPEYFRVRLRVSNNGDCYALNPQLIRSDVPFAVAALRYPATKDVSSREIGIRIL